jgi:hypothetical protein
MIVDTRRRHARPAPSEIWTAAPFLTVADNGHGVQAESDDPDSARRAARQLLEDGEPTPILQYVNGRRALGTYGDIGG